MTTQRAMRLAYQWANGFVCSIREGEAAEYHKMFLDMLRAQGETENNVLLTNADRIRAMSDEELADFLVELADDGSLKIREWLQQLAEED